MQRRLDQFLISKPGWSGAIRYALIAFLFIAGTLGTTACSKTASDPLWLMGKPGSGMPTTEEKLKSIRAGAEKEINKLKEELKWEQRSLTKFKTRLGKAKDPKDKAMLQRQITLSKARIAKLNAKIKHEVSIAKAACFPADMWVLTDDGAKPIGKIKVGDKVLSVNESGEKVISDVIKTYEKTNNHYYLINGTIKVTALHPFLTDEGWKKAYDLEVGDRMQTAAGKFEKIVSIELNPADLDVYNLTISKNHNFFISPDGKGGYLVHNTAGAGGGDGGDGDDLVKD